MSASSQPLPVSVCIPVRNEAANLPACLAALRGFSEVVVVDSHSTDATAELARQAGATVLQFDWDGKFPKKRNWALRNHHFANPWVLFLDADERMNEAFVAELRAVLPTTPHNGLWISFTNWFLGRPLRHGDTMRKLALLRLGSGEYEQFPEDAWTTLDMEVHEHPILTGSTGELRTRLDHLENRSPEAHLARHHEYAVWEARRFLWLHSPAAPADAWTQLNPRQRFKYRYLDRVWFPWLYWLATLFVKRGVLDGLPGLRFVSLKRQYFTDVRCRIKRSSKS